MTTVVLADDQDLVRSGLRALLEARGIDVLAEASTGRAAVHAAAECRPDVVVMDIRMPGTDGIAATEQISAAGLLSRVLILTTYDLDAYVYRALRAGAAGFMLKASPPDRLADAIQVIAAGEALLAPALLQRLIAEHIRRPPPADGVPPALASLTDREREVLVLLARGLSNEEIASTLVVAETTVKTHVTGFSASRACGAGPRRSSLPMRPGWSSLGTRRRRFPSGCSRSSSKSTTTGPLRIWMFCAGRGG